MGNVDCGVSRDGGHAPWTHAGGWNLSRSPCCGILQIDRVMWAQINLWATLIGSVLCLGIGRLLDRFGSRTVLTTVSLLLGCVVFAMSRSTTVFWLAVLITLSRGFGQSALSVVSLTIVGQWFVRRLSTAMGVYSILLVASDSLSPFPLLEPSCSRTAGERRGLESASLFWQVLARQAGY